MKALLIIIISLGHALAGFCANQHDERKSMVACTLARGRLAPFPKSMHDFSICTKGSIFSRAFRASFRAEPDALQLWMLQSPGLKETRPDTAQPGVRKFVVEPGGGAMYAEVSVDEGTGQVRIYVYWS